MMLRDKLRTVRTLFGLVLLLVLLFVLGAAHAQNYAQDYPLANLQEGQRGYALTTGPGDVIERFGIVVLGMQYDAAGFPLVLIRAEGDFIERSGGVAAGMSGSPVYLPYGSGDALLGAIGYTFPNSDHNLALVTPIEVMRRATPERIGGLEPFGDFPPLSDAVPVATPILIAGASERVGRWLEPLFVNSRVTPLPLQLSASGAPEAADANFTLRPGSAVSVQLVRGDITVGAVGTVTLIEDNRFWAFGHPLLGDGDVSFALAPAYISYIVPSTVVPFKLANNGQRILGRVSQDRPYALSGTLGADPDFVPVTLTLNGPARSVTKRFEISADERYYPELLAAASLQAFDETIEAVSAGSAELAWELTLADGEVLRLLAQLSDPVDIAGAVAQAAAEPLAVLSDNPFADPELSRINLSVSYRKMQRYNEIVSVSAEQSEIAPGELLTLYVRLQPYRAEPTVRTLRVALPEDATGTLDIVVRGGLELSAGEGDGGSGDDILSFTELLVALRDRVQSSELIVETYVGDDWQRLERITLDDPVYGEETITVTVTSSEEVAAAPSEPAGTPSTPVPSDNGSSDDSGDSSPIDPPINDTPPTDDPPPWSSRDRP
ncbi:MAG: hypothetical protein U5L04_08945 [Trueperaceae bacterium]|nr:hypothetical protein [Trueperaceae bacterium]